MVVNETGIFGFFNEYRFLSNFHVCEIIYEGISYPSSEAAYMSAKSTDLDVKKVFTTLEPWKARKAGQLIELRADWEKIKNQVMFDVNLDKYTRHEDLKKLLLATGNKYLEETNWWNDKYWGVCNGEGQNWLGKTLMKVRDQLMW